MSMYTLKSVARRSTFFGAAVAVFAATVMPAAPAFADALNPLTERSLLLSSSAPGFQDTDGSGNPTYAPPGSGPNGRQTGETFTFTVSSDGLVKGLSFQYCTTAAGYCKSPGNNGGDARTTPTPDRETNAVGHPNGTSDLDIIGDFGKALVGAEPADGEFQIYVNGTATAVDDWNMDKHSAEDDDWIDGVGAHEQGLTGKPNYISLASPTGINLTAGQEVRVVFEASGANYITNPGYGSFFVKINTYDTDDLADAVNTDGDAGDASQGFTHITPLSENNHVIDGGVTVANVMTDSIHIVTKVLETMSFSVGIQNPDTTDKDAPQTHGTCAPISQTNTLTGLTNNRLNLGNPNAEYSLETGQAWDVNSYWRLSSNSSGGATVYYSGDTLRNTSGDFIAESGATAAASQPGTEQFGLGFVDATADDLNFWTPGEQGYVGDGDNDFWVDTDENGALSAGDTGIAFTNQDDYRLPSLHVLDEETEYAGATGDIQSGSGAAFAFESSSLDVPELIASNDDTVISCDTAKMRYVGNIAADTPAGVYTTKINYLAAPQY